MLLHAVTHHDDKGDMHIVTLVQAAEKGPCMDRVCAPEVVFAKHRFRTVEDPSATGGSLRIISCPGHTDMLGEAPHNQG